MSQTEAITSLSQRTALYPQHLDAGAKMVPFAGYDMPLHYSSGIIAEHKWVRQQAGLFDVSHMGVIQTPLQGSELERLIPADLSTLAPGQVKYSFLMNDRGGVEDDLLIARQEHGFLLVVNASRKLYDLAYLRDHGVSADLQETGILALQGPQARHALTRLIPEVAAMPFMTQRQVTYRDVPLTISCTGYTGEDGFEIIGDPVLVDDLLSQESVQWVGLGARDSLRLEAGLSLYGHELDDTITPIEAGLRWAIGQQRHFLGAGILQQQIELGTNRIRVGLRLSPGGIPRQGAVIVDSDQVPCGIVTSGGFSPNLECPVLLGLVTPSSRQNELFVDVRGQMRTATLIKLPFVPHQYVRGFA